MPETKSADLAAPTATFTAGGIVSAKPVRCEYKALPDITTYELALLMPY